MSFPAGQPSLPSHSSLSQYSPISCRFPSFNLPFPSSSKTLSSSTMDNNPGRIPYSAYQSSAYLPPTQQPLPDSFPATLPSQMPSWTHPFDASTPVTQQMWLPMPGMSQQMPSPLHHQHSPLQQSPYDMSFPMASPLSHTRSERSHSLQTSTSLSLSTGLPSPEQSPREAYHRADSPGHADLNLYGWMNPDGTWKCAYPGCTSRAVFTRGCDLRKHHKRHTKSFFCRYPGCTQSSGGGFSSKKDLARHEAKHNPGVVCEWSGCDRIFSRVDNMVRFHFFIFHGAQRFSATVLTFSLTEGPCKTDTSQSSSRGSDKSKSMFPA